MGLPISVVNLRAHGCQVVASRKVINIGAQSGPEFFWLTTVIPFRHHLIDASPAVHDLFHLYFCFEIIRCGVELTPKAVCRAVQIVHGLFEVVFGLIGLVCPGVCIC